MDHEEALPCADKITFESKDEAQVAGTVAEYRYGSRLMPYKCQYCSLWHLSSH